MKLLAEEKKYEEAAEIRDIVNQILGQLNRSSILAEPVNKANALIKINSGSKSDYILFSDGKLLIKNLPNEDEKMFELTIEDYFNSKITSDENSTKKDLSRMKIALSWLVNNRNLFEIFYLKDFNSAEQILEKM
jgi:endoglucanase Acf2